MRYAHSVVLDSHTILELLRIYIRVESNNASKQTGHRSLLFFENGGSIHRCDSQKFKRLLYARWKPQVGGHLSIGSRSNAPLPHIVILLSWCPKPVLGCSARLAVVYIRRRGVSGLLDTLYKRLASRLKI